MAEPAASYLETARQALGAAAAALALAQTEHSQASCQRLTEELEAAMEAVTMAWQAVSLAQHLAQEEAAWAWAAAQKADPS